MKLSAQEWLPNLLPRRSADFPVCGLWGLSSPHAQLTELESSVNPQTGKSALRRECARWRLVLCLLNSYTLVAPILGSGEARRGSIPRSGAVTEEQRSQNPKSVQPAGRHVFLAQTSLFAPHRSMKDMLVAHASSEPKIHCRQCIAI